jgi:DNA-directed RNA polymerase subunit F
MNELERIQEIVNILDKAVAMAKKWNTVNARIPTEVAEELVDILSDSLRTIKDYQVFDHTLPLPPKQLGVKS